MSPLQITGGKDEANIALMRKSLWNSERKETQ